MTPAIKVIENAGLPFTIHEYTHDSDHHSWGLEAAEKLGVPANRVYKTLVVSLEDGELIVGLVPVDAQLSLKRLARAAGGKRATMAEKQRVERATGYVLGGVSPLGQKKRLRTFIDASAKQQTTVYISAGRRALEIELAPENLLTLTGGQYAGLQQD